MRGATEAPIDLALGLLASVLAAVAFMQVLWDVGGDLTIKIFGLIVVLPGYLVVAAVVYSALITAAMIIIGRNLTQAIEERIGLNPSSDRRQVNLVRATTMSPHGKAIEKNVALLTRP